MSAARECDRCGVLFRPVPGCISVDLNVVTPATTEAGVVEQGWTEIELCLECTAPVVAHLKVACNDFDDVVSGKDVGRGEPES